MRKFFDVEAGGRGRGASEVSDDEDTLGSLEGFVVPDSQVSGSELLATPTRKASSGCEDSYNGQEQCAQEVPDFGAKDVEVLTSSNSDRSVDHGDGEAGDSGSLPVRPGRVTGGRGSGGRRRAAARGGRIRKHGGVDGRTPPRDAARAALMRRIVNDLEGQAETLTCLGNLLLSHGQRMGSDAEEMRKLF